MSTLRKIAKACGYRVVLEARNPMDGSFQRDLPPSQLLREARKEAHLKQTELERLSGVGQTMISDYEIGRREPRIPQLRRLLEACGITLMVDFVRL